jgi:hypothetical protein
MSVASVRALRQNRFPHAPVCLQCGHYKRAPLLRRAHCRFMPLTVQDFA